MVALFKQTWSKSAEYVPTIGHRVKHGLDHWTLGLLDYFLGFVLGYFLDHFLDQFFRLLIVREGWVGRFHHLWGGEGHYIP